VGLDSTPFAGGSKKSVAFPWPSFNGWLQCPAKPWISQLAVRLGYGSFAVRTPILTSLRYGIPLATDQGFSL